MTKLSATDIAKLSASISGGQPTRSRNKDAAINKLRSTAEAANIGRDLVDAALGSADLNAAMAALKGADPKPATKKLSKREAQNAEAARGVMPARPDYSAKTHQSHAKLIASVFEAVDAKDLPTLKAFEFKSYSSTQRSVGRYRDLSVIALEASASSPHSFSSPGRLLTEMKQGEYEQAVIDDAAYYTASRKAGVGKFDTREAKTESEIREIAASMGAGTMINAINAAGRQSLIDTIR